MNTSGESEADRLERRAREAFDASVERLDGRTRSRLSQARHAALAELKRTQALRARWPFLVPAGGLAASAALALFFIARPTTDSFTQQAPPLEDLEIAASVENIELLEDMEFYAWLAEQNQGSPDRNSG